MTSVRVDQLNAPFTLNRAGRNRSLIFQECTGDGRQGRIRFACCAGHGWPTVGTTDTDLINECCRPVTFLLVSQTMLPTEVRYAATDFRQERSIWGLGDTIIAV